MIVGSLLLILVAVTLLVLGLTGGSSTLLISSIVASLLAAVALVIGARQASSRRVTEPGGPDVVPLAVDLDDDPGPPAPVEETAGWATPDGDDRLVPVDVAAADTVVGTRGSAPGSVDPAAPARAEAAPGSADTEIITHEAVRSARAESDDPYADFHRERFTAGAQDGPTGDARTAVSEPEASNAGSPDAGSPDESLHDDSSHRAPDLHTDETEHDDEDPADEPPPQRLQPADAVQVSRMIAEVLVVDGRPRYHLGDCPSLTDRVTEPLPVSEAVELGFTPCSMCRPVDRLVAEAVSR